MRNLPENALHVCLACGDAKPRGSVSALRKKGWLQVLDSADTPRAWTCPACPEVGEPIQRAVTKAGVVRFRTIMTLPSGKQQWRTWNTLVEARAHVAKVRAGIEAGEDVGTKAETVEALCERWLKGKRKVRPVTREGYYFALRPVVRRLGQRQVGSLRLNDVRGLIDWMETEGASTGKALGAPGIRAAMIAFAQVLDLAVAEKVLDANPARDKTVELPSVRGRAGFGNLEWWEWDTLLQFRDTADADPYAALWRLTLTGLTRADICGLRWSDVDLDAGTVTVSQGRVSLQGQRFIEANEGQRSIIGEPKSGQRWRTVEPDRLHPGTMALLRALKARQAADRLKAGTAYDTSHDLVLVDALGAPVRPEWYSDRFRHLCDDAGVKRIHLHSCRHSLAKRMDDLRVPMAARAALLGHRVDVHLSTYLPSATSTGTNDALDLLGSGTRQSAAE
ncbi:tyrosine-type recombinase/integrase [Terrabacter tumescens]|uniref:tyrosine-type recombinase/integrase n=1 Tax=Terrabacter tumescens TaxID=60443 RepID=UPI0004C22E3A|nr:tyrosine-type recombinase/integrase [Terrabacter tumescens]